MSLSLAKVIKFHPESNAADLLFIDDGSRVPMVQVMCGNASTDSGTSDFAQPGESPSGNEWDPQNSKGRDVFAVVGFYRKVPIVMGFLFPQIAECLFQRDNFKVDRHASDVYTVIDANGNTELYHPSGTYFRIATNPDHEDLTGKDFDGRWKITKNTDKAVHVRLMLRNAGVQKGLIEIDPDGNAKFELAGDMDISVGGDMSITTEKLTVDGDIDVTGDVVAAGISLSTHTHGGVQSGSGSTGTPE